MGAGSPIGQSALCANTVQPARPLQMFATLVVTSQGMVRSCTLYVALAMRMLWASRGPVTHAAKASKPNRENTACRKVLS